MTEPAARRTLALAAVAAGTFVFFLLTARGYGYFRDELYYLACADHLDFGYVDHPPLIALLAGLGRALGGDSLVAIRFLPALAAAATVFLAGATAAELGGGRFAQLLAAAATLLAPIYLSLFTILSMNAFDVLIWAACFWVIARILRTGEERLWLAFGALAGIGLQNKISVLFLGFGLGIGLLLGRREVLRSPWLWAGGAIAGLIFLPHLIWQAANGWPTLEFMENARRFKMAAVSPSAFVSNQVLLAGPAALPLWLSGLGFFLFAARGRAFRPLGWAYLVILAVMIATEAKAYYLGPAYTILFAGGAVAIELASSRGKFRALRPAVVALLAGGGVLAAPLAKPLLPVETYLGYAAWLGIQPTTAERHELGRLPQFYADMTGWPELAETVAGVYRRLPAEERSAVCIFGQNYGQAGAIDLLGPAYGLPPAISAHNSYYLWGPRGCSGEIIIVIGDNRERLQEVFESVELAATYTCADCMPYENHKPIWIARGLRRPLSELWPQIKRFI
jgi:4-amino-4-deoxy-L-arabinose transferase-like glycosyltransferase